MIKIICGGIGVGAGVFVGSFLESGEFRYGEITLLVTISGVMGGFIGVVIGTILSTRGSHIQPLRDPGGRVNVFAGPVIEADLISLHLHEHGIDAQLEDENIGMVAPYAAAGGSFGAVNVSVPIDDASNARELIERHRGQAETVES